MDEIHVKILTANVVCLGDDLDPSLIFNHLIEGRALSSKEEEHIKSLKSRHEMADELIRKLIRKGREDFGVFLRALRPTHHHLFERLYQQLKEEDPEADLSEVLYEKLPPSVARQALETFGKRTAMVHTEVIRLREATKFLEGFLAASDLPVAIDDSASVPLSLSETSAKIRDMGGATLFTEQIADLAKLLRKSRAVLVDSEELIATEEDADAKLSQKYKQNWTRMSSVKLTKSIKEEAGKYDSGITAQMKAIQVLEDGYSGLSDDIEILGQSDDDLERSLPSSAEGHSSNLILNASQLMDEIAVIQEERKALDDEIQQVNTTVLNKMIVALEQRGLLDCDVISTEIVDGLLTPFRGRITESVQRQEKLLVDIKTINSKFQEERAQKHAPCQRDKKVKDLEAAFVSFCDCRMRMQELSKLCNGLGKTIEKHHSEVKFFCCNRKTEKAELLKDIQNAIPDANTASLEKATLSVVTDHDTSPNQSWVVGNHKGNIWELDSNQTWKSIEKPYKSTLYSACSAPGGFIISGGHVNLKGKSDCNSYIAHTRQWTMLPPLATGRYDHSSICYNDQLHIIAGGTSKNALLNTVETLDLKSNKWSSLEPLPRALLSPFVVVVSDKLYVLGGSENKSKYSCEVHEYSAELKSWQPRVSMPNECRGGSAVSFHSKIYVVGGETKICMHYTPCKDQWVLLKTPQLNHWHGPAFVLNGKIIVCGGDKHSTVEEYDPQSDGWSTWKLQVPEANRLHFALELSSTD